MTDVQALRATLARTFHTRTVTALDILADTIEVAPDRRSVVFLEVESTEDPVTLVQQTRLFRTTWGLTQDQGAGTVTVRIGAVQREGPLVQVTTPGQVQAGALTRVAVQGTSAPFALAGVEVTVPETETAQALRAIDNAWQGVFTPPMQPSPQPLRVQLHGVGGETLVLQHSYRLRISGERVVARVVGTGTTRVFAVTVAPDGTVWAGGDGGAILYKVPPGATRATQVGYLLVPPDGRVEAVAVDQLGRLHALVLDLAQNEVVGHGDIVFDPAFPDVFCRTVNIFDTAYPFREPHGQPSASTRVLAAGEGDVWLFGSDGGVARVQDSFRGGQCPEGPTVRYAPVFRRDTSALPTNTVPAFVAEADGTLWFGTAVGLTRLQQGHFTPVPFARPLTVPGDVATLEAFFQAVAQALFAAQPLTTVALGGVSFVEQFGRPLVKEELLFSAVAVALGQLWVGTLGGGLRRIDGRGATPQDTRHLTQLDGLPSNLIVALAVDPDGVLWVATDKGVSHLREAGDAVLLTTFAALDGLALPVRDVAVDAAGTVWLATDGGLFRLVAQGGMVQGRVVDAASRPVEEADVTLQDMPFHAVTDSTGRFVLANLPSGPQQLQVDGRLAVGGPFSVALRAITVPDEGTQTLETIVLEPQTPGEPRTLITVLGDGQTGTVGTTLAAPLVVAVAQAGGAPVPGFPVTFTVTAGQGTLVPSQPVLTDAQGRAAVTLTLGTREGVQQVTATAPGLAPITFTVTGVADKEHVRLLLVSGNNQVGKPGEILPLPLVVRLEDQFGNPVAGVLVTGEVILGGVVFVGPPVAPASSADRFQMAPTESNGEARFFIKVISTVSQALVQMTAPQVAAPVRFLLNVTRISVGAVPESVAVADLNGDGIPDLVAANTLSNDVSVLLGRGEGTFAPEQRFPVGTTTAPSAVAVADLNHDGLPDLVTTNANSNDVSVLLGHGDGTFAAPQRVTVGIFPQSVAVADLNHDGLPDLVTANAGSNDVSVLLGRGDGTFTAPRRFTVGTNPVSVAIGDLNGDLIPDLVTADPVFSAVTVLLGLGDGTFEKLQLGPPQ